MLKEDKSKRLKEWHPQNIPFMYSAHNVSKFVTSSSRSFSQFPNIHEKLLALLVFKDDIFRDCRFKQFINIESKFVTSEVSNIDKSRL